MQPGESVMDLENLDEEDWDRYDCPFCRFVEKETSEANSNGLVWGLLDALAALEEINVARNTGMSKLDIFRQIVLKIDPDGYEIKNETRFMPLMIIMSEDEAIEVLPLCPVSHNVPLTTYYVSTEGSEDIWRCGECGLEVRTNVSLRAIPLRPQA